MTIKVVELFAGVGGFRIGFEEASKEFKTIWANQWEPGKKSQWAYECYVSHFGKGSCINEDINKVKNDCPKHDLLCGGFPCQDYSVAHTGAKGIEGKKGVLWWDIRDIVDAKRPKYILLENVDRLVKSPASKRGRDFGIILKSLNDLGYAVEWRIVNAADYGCAQRRRRVFIFAYHKKTTFYKSVYKTNKYNLVFDKGFFSDVFPGKQEKLDRINEFDLSKYKDLAEVTDKFTNQFWNAGVCIDGKGLTVEQTPDFIKPTPLSAIVEKDGVDESYFLNTNQIKQFEYLRGPKKLERTRPNGEKYFYSEGGMSPVDYLDLPARTMLTSEGGVNRSTHIIEDPKTGKKRFLTQLECERINGFPDNWTNTGMPQKFRYFTMGNALVVPLVEKMGRKIKSITTIK